MSRQLAHLSDEALVALVARGDEPALAELYDRVGRIAYGLAYRVLRDERLAEDAVQEGFLAVWRTASSYLADRAKARAVRRDPKVSLCVLDEKWPPSYLLVYAAAAVETEFERVVELMLRIAGVMAGRPMPESVRPLVEEGARREKRVVLRCRPYATFHSPPKHVHQASDIGEKLLHDLGSTLPW